MSSYPLHYLHNTSGSLMQGDSPSVSQVLHSEPTPCLAQVKQNARYPHNYNQTYPAPLEQSAHLGISSVPAGSRPYPVVNPLTPVTSWDISPGRNSSFPGSHTFYSNEGPLAIAENQTRVSHMQHHPMNDDQTRTSMNVEKSRSGVPDARRWNPSHDEDLTRHSMYDPRPLYPPSAAYPNHSPSCDSHPKFSANLAINSPDMSFNPANHYNKSWNDGQQVFKVPERTLDVHLGYSQTSGQQLQSRFNSQVIPSPAAQFSRMIPSTKMDGQMYQQSHVKNPSRIDTIRNIVKEMGNHDLRNLLQADQRLHSTAKQLIISKMKEKSLQKTDIKGRHRKSSMQNQSRISMIRKITREMDSQDLQILLQTDQRLYNAAENLIVTEMNANPLDRVGTHGNAGIAPKDMQTGKKEMLKKFGGRQLTGTHRRKLKLKKFMIRTQSRKDQGDGLEGGSGEETEEKRDTIKGKVLGWVKGTE